MKKLFLFFLILGTMKGFSQITYTPMTAAGYSYKYIKADSGLTIPFHDTSLFRGTTRPGSLVINTADSLLYLWNGSKWNTIQGGGGSVTGAYIDSAVISGQYFFYQKQGVWYGLQLPQDSADIYIGQGTGTDTLFKIINGDTSIVTYLDRPDGSIDCRVTHLTGLDYNVSSTGGTSPCVFILGGKRYNVTGADITLTSPDPVYPRRDYIGVDTTGIPIKIDGIADPAPTLPSYDHGSQLMLQDFILYPGDTTGTVYIGIKDSVGVVAPLKSDSTTWPGHQTLSLDVNHMPRLDYEGASRDTTTWGDTTLIDKGFLNARISGFSSGGGTILDTTFQWSVLDSLSTPNPGSVAGDIYLVGTVPTGAFVSHANEIATFDGSSYTFDVASVGDLLYNAATDFVSKWNGTTWRRIGRATLHQGGDKYAATIVVGASDNRAMALRTNNVNRITIAAAGGITLNSLTGSGTQLVAISSTGLLSRTTAGGGSQTTADSTLTATALQTAFTFSSVPASYADYSIFINGSKAIPTVDYTTSGSVVTLTATDIDAGDKINYKRIK